MHRFNLWHKRKNSSISTGYNCSVYDCDLIRGDDDLPGTACLNHLETEKLNGEFDNEYCHKLSIEERHPCCYYDDGFEKKMFFNRKNNIKNIINL